MTSTPLTRSPGYCHAFIFCKAWNAASNRFGVNLTYPRFCYIQHHSYLFERQFLIMIKCNHKLFLFRKLGDNTFKDVLYLCKPHFLRGFSLPGSSIVSMSLISFESDPDPASIPLMKVSLWGNFREEFFVFLKTYPHLLHTSSSKESCQAGFQLKTL